MTHEFFQSLHYSALHNSAMTLWKQNDKGQDDGGIQLSR